MREIKKVLYGLFALIILFPIVLNLIMFLPISITTKNLGEAEWLSFWGSYFGGAIGGLGTIIAVFFTIKYYEKQSEDNKKALLNFDNLSRINSMIERITNRDSIPSSYFLYSPLLVNSKEKLERYNYLLGSLVSFFSDKAMGLFISLLYIRDEEGEELTNNLKNYYKIPQDVKDYAYIVSKYALYENATEMIKSDPRLAHMIQKESGGSYGMWHEYIHFFGQDHEYMDLELKEFFMIIPEIILELEEIKAKMS